MADYFTIWAWTVNVGRADSAAQADDSIEKVVNAFDSNGNPGDTIGIQEADEDDKGDEHSMWSDHLPGYKWVGKKKMVPIGVDPKWNVVNPHSTPTHPGLKKVTPDRPIVDCLLQHTQHAWAEIGWINSHAVAGAFTNPGQAKERDRRDYWFWWWGTMRALVLNYTRENIPVICTMDSNNPNQPKIHPNERRFMHSSLDYILVVEPDDSPIHLEKTNSKKVDLKIDGHDAHAVAIKIHRL